MDIRDVLNQVQINVGGRRQDLVGCKSFCRQPVMFLESWGLLYKSWWRPESFGILRPVDWETFHDNPFWTPWSSKRRSARRHGGVPNVGRLHYFFCTRSNLCYEKHVTDLCNWGMFQFLLWWPKWGVPSPDNTWNVLSPLKLWDLAQVLLLQQDRQSTYNATLMCVHEAIVAVEKQ